MLARSGAELPVWMHVLYLPTAKLIEETFGASSLTSLQVLSAVSGGLGLAGTYLLGRALGLPRRNTSLSVAALGLSAAMWLHSTIVELHSFHLCIAAWSGLLAWRAGRMRGLAGTACLLIACSLCYLSHRSGALILPGVVLLFLWSARETGLLGARRLVEAGAGSLAGLVLALLVANRVCSGGWALSVDSTTSFIESSRRGFSARYLWEGVVRALGLVLLVGIGGGLELARHGRRSLAVVMTVLVLPSLAFFFWYGETNTGGYALSVAPFLCVMGAGFPWHRIHSIWIVAALAVQLAGGWTTTHSPQFAELESLAQSRAAAVDALIADGGGILISVDRAHQTVNGRSKGVLELDQWSILQIGARRGMPPTAFSEYVLDLIARLQAEGDERLFVDVSFQNEYDAYPRLRSYGEHLLAALHEAFECERVQHGEIVFLKLGDRK